MPDSVRVRGEIGLALPLRLGNKVCRRCGHRLREHWWWEPEFHCLVGWDLVAGVVGCSCGEFEGVDWLDVMDRVRRTVA